MQQTATDSDLASFMFVSFLKIFKQNITAMLIKDIRASVHININNTSGLSKNAVSLLFTIMKYIGEILFIS